MNNEFEKRIKELEREILDLKAASKYTGIRSASETTSQRLGTGRYRVTYQSGHDVLSLFFAKNDTDKGYALIYPQPPQSNTQIIDVNATYVDLDGGTPTTSVNFYIWLTVISNVPVVSITRIS